MECHRLRQADFCHLRAYRLMVFPISIGDWPSEYLESQARVFGMGFREERNALLDLLDRGNPADANNSSRPVKSRLDRRTQAFGIDPLMKNAKLRALETKALGSRGDASVNQP